MVVEEEVVGARLEEDGLLPLYMFVKASRIGGLCRRWLEGRTAVGRRRGWRFLRLTGKGTLSWKTLIARFLSFECKYECDSLLLRKHSIALTVSVMER